MDPKTLNDIWKVANHSFFNGRKKGSFLYTVKSIVCADVFAFIARSDSACFSFLIWQFWFGFGSGGKKYGSHTRSRSEPCLKLFADGFLSKYWFFLVCWLLYGPFLKRENIIRLSLPIFLGAMLLYERVCQSIAQSVTHSLTYSLTFFCLP